MTNNDENVRCPGCRKKLLEALSGMAVAKCPRCKTTIRFRSRPDGTWDAWVIDREGGLTYQDAAPMIAEAMGSPKTTRRPDGTYEHTWEFTPD